MCSTCGKSSALATWGKVPKRVAESYPEGTHGAKKRAQKRLKTSGKTHQSEHTVGYEVFGDSLDRGKSPFAQVIENRAPAYQEELDAHRGHIGTGTWKDYRKTGVSSDQYRRDQRRMVSNKQVGNAVQFNQLNYAYQPEFRNPDPAAKPELEKADDSFERMVISFQPVPFKFGDTWSQVPVTGAEKAEMLLARKEARTSDHRRRFTGRSMVPVHGSGLSDGSQSPHRPASCMDDSLVLRNPHLLHLPPPGPGSVLRQHEPRGPRDFALYSPAFSPPRSGDRPPLERSHHAPKISNVPPRVASPTATDANVGSLRRARQTAPPAWSRSESSAVNARKSAESETSRTLPSKQTRGANASTKTNPPSSGSSHGKKPG
ncbi:hypothetical protein H7849_10045 [Alloacidobacterium dinghuense]|uniref:Uncharacterized protein n=1 Tax=Alloacidobacterium dinghuense TaxID=2763107 RepID=A0A7G8BNS9_9BACT|nr:hypothetical protein H7849_10045 [Alloacidobacterium dinghuense]